MDDLFKVLVNTIQHKRDVRVPYMKKIRHTTTTSLVTVVREKRGLTVRTFLHRGVYHKVFPFKSRMPFLGTQNASRKLYAYVQKT